jgi:hypothetical protein
MNVFHQIALPALALICLGGCASYGAGAAPVPKPEGMPVWRAMEQVAAGADPYVQLKRQEAVFDADLNEVGVLAIQVLLANHSDRSLLVRSSDMRLVLPDGRTIETSGASRVMAHLEKPHVHFWATFFLGLPGALGAASYSDTEKAARLTDYRNKQFHDVTLGKGESAHGFLFLIPSTGTPPFNEATMTIRFVDTDTASSLTVNLPVTGLGFPGNPVKD